MENMMTETIMGTIVPEKDLSNTPCSWNKACKDKSYILCAGQRLGTFTIKMIKKEILKILFEQSMNKLIRDEKLTYNKADNTVCLNQGGNL